MDISLDTIFESSFDPEGRSAPLIKGKADQVFRLRRATPDDGPALCELQRAAWGEEHALPDELIERDLRLFPFLQVVAELQSTRRLVGRAGSHLWDPQDPAVNPNRLPLERLVRFEDGQDWNVMHEQGVQGSLDLAKATWAEGTDLMVDPAFRGLGLGRVLLAARLKLLVEHQEERGVQGLPPLEACTSQSCRVGFKEWCVQNPFLAAREDVHRRYYGLVLGGTVRDPVLSTHLELYRGHLEANAGMVEVLNHNAPWHGDELSGNAGVRIRYDTWVNSLVSRR